MAEEPAPEEIKTWNTPENADDVLLDDLKPAMRPVFYFRENEIKNALGEEKSKIETCELLRYVPETDKEVGSKLEALPVFGYIPNDVAIFVDGGPDEGLYIKHISYMDKEEDGIMRSNLSETALQWESIAGGLKEEENMKVETLIKLDTINPREVWNLRSGGVLIITATEAMEVLETYGTIKREKIDLVRRKKMIDEIVDKAHLFKQDAEKQVNKPTINDINEMIDEWNKKGYDIPIPEEKLVQIIHKYGNLDLLTAVLWLVLEIDEVGKLDENAVIEKSIRTAFHDPNATPTLMIQKNQDTKG